MCPITYLIRSKSEALTSKASVLEGLLQELQRGTIYHSLVPNAFFTWAPTSAAEEHERLEHLEKRLPFLDSQYSFQESNPSGGLLSDDPFIFFTRATFILLS